MHTVFKALGYVLASVAALALAPVVSMIPLLALAYLVRGIKTLIGA